MLYYDHSKGEVVRTKDALLRLSRKRDYSELLKSARINLSDINVSGKNNETHTFYSGDLTLAGRYVAYSHNQESFKFMIDPMLETGIERYPPWDMAMPLMRFLTMREVSQSTSLKCLLK